GVATGRLPGRLDVADDPAPEPALLLGCAGGTSQTQQFAPRCNSARQHGHPPPGIHEICATLGRSCRAVKCAAGALLTCGNPPVRVVNFPEQTVAEGPEGLSGVRAIQLPAGSEVECGRWALPALRRAICCEEGPR